MKRCPKCNANYFDNMLEFCLEDGTQLASSPGPAMTANPTVPIPPVARTAGPIASQVSEETVVVGPPKHERTGTEPRPEQIREPASSIGVIERAGVGLALAHNWWQWLYLEKTYVYSITDYILSANFLMWLLLFGTGTAAGIYSFKRSKDKTFAIITLLLLAINLILFLVPRR
ncbi:MAG: hypothetical protein AB7F88_02965 [Pyrinomonadaceae bacterium]